MPNLILTSILIELFNNLFEYIHSPMSMENVKICTKWATILGIFETAVKIRYTRMTLFCDEENAQNGKENDLADRKVHKTIFLFIPGNPGNDRFYTAFGEYLLREYSHKFGRHNLVPFRQLEFYSIGHAGHVPTLDGPNRRFNLAEQCAIKMECCLQILKEIEDKNEYDGRKIYLIGHSIGALIAMRILPKLLENGWNVSTCFCLFPTVEQMADTPNGKWIGPIVKAVDNFDWLFRPFFGLLNFLPIKFKEWLARRIFDNDVPECVIGAVGELANSSVARNIAHLANNELHVVLDFDDSLLSESIKQRLVFFYGRADKWAPLEFAERMRQRLPETGRVLIDSRMVDGFEHAFVLKYSREMAELLVEMIMEGA